jgi:probable rRNA maturation factor
LVILQKQVAGLSSQALARFVQRARAAAGLPGSVDVLITGSAVMRRLNLRFRKKNQTTDVLSFPAAAAGKGTRGSVPAGEIAISADIATQNALRLGHSPAYEIKILALHGILHLAGFDHEQDNGDMARKERTLRKQLRLPTALIERSHPDRRSAARGPRGRSPRTA